jgi:hypothetical protein
VVLDGVELLHLDHTGICDRYEWLPMTLPDGVQLLLTVSTVALDGSSEESVTYASKTSSSLDILKVSFNEH